MNSDQSTRINERFDNTKEAKWLKENAYKYGFILRYPKGKENITQYKFESWHYRYLVVEDAAKVHNSGMTLEEYLGLDQKSMSISGMLTRSGFKKRSKSKLYFSGSKSVIFKA